MNLVKGQGKTLKSVCSHSCTGSQQTNSQSYKSSEQLQSFLASELEERGKTTVYSPYPSVQRFKGSKVFSVQILLALL